MMHLTGKRISVFLSIIEKATNAQNHRNFMLQCVNGALDLYSPVRCGWVAAAFCLPAPGKRNIL